MNQPTALALAGTYYASAYFLAKSSAETLFQLLNPVLFSATVYFLVVRFRLVWAHGSFMAYLGAASCYSPNAKLTSAWVTRVPWGLVHLQGSHTCPPVSHLPVPHQPLTPGTRSLAAAHPQGFQAVASKFFIFTGFMILCSLAATSLALAVSAVARTTDM